MNNSKLLVQWLAATIVDNPKLITDLKLNKEAKMKFYKEIFDIWAGEIQSAVQELYKKLKE